MGFDGFPGLSPSFSLRDNHFHITWCYLLSSILVDAQDIVINLQSDDFSWILKLTYVDLPFFTFLNIALDWRLANTHSRLR